MIKKRALAKYGVAGVVVLAVATMLYLYIPVYFGDTVYPLKYEEYIRTYSSKYDVDPALVAAVILQESRFNPSSVSSVGAQGLMQFMPGTAATMAKETGRWPNYNIFDAETSVEFGAAHLRDLLVKYNGNVDLALYAYNTGTGNAAKYINSPASIANFSYVKKIRNYQTVYRSMYAKELGLEPIKIEKVEDSKSDVRGFVWSQIFSNFAGYFDKNENKTE